MKNIENAIGFDEFSKILEKFMHINNFTHFQIMCIKHCINSFYKTLPELK